VFSNLLPHLLEFRRVLRLDRTQCCLMLLLLQRRRRAPLLAPPLRLLCRPRLPIRRSTQLSTQLLASFLQAC
jgi:hypothetical protein